VASNAASTRTLLLAAWIFGCAAYYYVRFTYTFAAENESALRRVFPAAANLLPSARANR
jgi:hypothetical protein